MTVRSLRPGWIGVLILMASVSPAGAERGVLRGAAELQYQSSERVGVATPLETWIKTLRMDYARRMRGSLELSSHLVFSEQTLAGRPDRTRTPQGNLQLSHPYFSVLASYRPSEVRDVQGRTTRQQELSFNGYVQGPRLPRVTGSWIRRHYEPGRGIPAAAAVTRSLTSVYNLGATSFRAGYGDQYREGVFGSTGRAGESHYNLGASSQFRVGAGGLSTQYDFNQSRADPTGSRITTTRQHSAGINGGMRLSKRTSTGLAYSYRRTESVGTGRSPLEEHDGSLSLGHQLNSAVQLSGAAGVRSARINGANPTERYLVASASAQGEARPGWRMDAAASHSLNWLPGIPARPADNVRATTSMRLTPGLDFRGDLSLSATRNPLAPRHSPLELGLQSAAGIVASPLRTVSLDATVQRARAGVSLLRGGSSSSSYAANLRLRPSGAFQLNGGWGMATNSGTRSTTWQSGFQWSPRPTFQASGAYSRAAQERSDPTAPMTTSQESVSGSLAVALARNLSGTVRYAESNPGRTGSVRQISALLIQRFGR
jgi:hypothetical protein